MEVSYTIHETVKPHLEIDCDELEVYTVIPKATTIPAQRGAVVYKPKRRYNGVVRVLLKWAKSKRKK